MQNKIYWVGPRKSDIAHVKDVNFYGSITLFGDGKNNNYAYCTSERNRVNHNVSDKNEDIFFYNTITNIIAEDESARFYFYNPNMVYYVEGLEEYKKYFLCINERALMSNANNKQFFQNALTGIVPLLDRKFDKFHKNNSDYLNLIASFNRNPNEKCRFIFQAPVSSGGNGTYLIDSDNVKDAIQVLESDNYIISLYEEKNIPINIHAVIFESEIILSPGSVQIMKEDDNRLLYRGADFITYRNIQPDLREKFENYVLKVCKVFQSLGYRGVCGIDGMICSDKNEVVLLELNNRFQASTGLINLATEAAGLPTLQKINLAAFENAYDESFRALQSLQVNFSNYFYSDNGTKFHSNYIRDICRNFAERGSLSEINVFEIEDDGYNGTQNTNALAYLYRVIFSTNITALNAENCVRTNENVCEPPKLTWYDKICRGLKVSSKSKEEIKEYFIRLKIALLTQGVVLDDKFVEYLEKNNKNIRPATNNAIDIKINLSDNGIVSDRYLIVNTPVDIKFVQFSPFTITRENDENYIYYYGQKLTQIDETYDKDFLSDKTTSTNMAYSEVGFLSTDRLRVHITNACIFKDDNGGGCKFCNIKKSESELSLEAVEEVVKDYCMNAGALGLKHFLVGGQTAAPEKQEMITGVIKIIRKYARYADVYAMVVPYPEKTLKAMCDAGMNQLSCNIEVFNDEIAKKYMPRKRAVPRATYIDRLRYATTLMGRTGNVRSMIIVGLEPFSDFFNGIEELARNGIQPILSIFRPLPETELKNMCAPSMEELYSIYIKSQAICKKYNLLLGPKCINCQNNTLALPYWMEE